MTQLPILFEDGEALVIDKPAGLAIGPTRDCGRGLAGFRRLMESPENRYTRQRRLAEVGDAGQARIGRGGPRLTHRARTDDGEHVQRRRGGERRERGRGRGGRHG